MATVDKLEPGMVVRYKQEEGPDLCPVCEHYVMSFLIVGRRYGERICLRCARKVARLVGEV